VPGRYFGASLGDHGDAWTVAWQVTYRDRHSVTVYAEIGALPLRMERRAYVSDAKLRLDYELSATDGEAVVALWAAHPLFACTEQTRVALPSEVTEVLDVIEVRQRAPVAWPGDLDCVACLPAATGRKLYVPPGQNVGSARLVDGDGASLEMAWDPALCPYLGLWLDNGWLSDGPVAALEPAIAYCDELTLATELGTAAHVGAAPVQWWVEVTLH
jgi:galactose mutarotase-like enzyme